MFLKAFVSSSASFCLPIGSFVPFFFFFCELFTFFLSFFFSFFLWLVLSFFFSFFLVFRRGKHWKGFNRQAVLNQPTNQLICLFVTLPWVFFFFFFWRLLLAWRGAFSEDPLAHTHPHTRTHTPSVNTSQADERDSLQSQWSATFFKRIMMAFKSMPISTVSIWTTIRGFTKTGEGCLLKGFVR